MNYQDVIPVEVAERFWSGVNQRSVDECWDWTRGISNNGYGVFTHRYKSIATHRLAFSLQNGDIPDGLMVCHKCDRKCCCNPNHMFLGTGKDNMQDAISKGLLRMYHENVEFVSSEDGKKILAAVKSGMSYKEAAVAFSLKKSTVEYVCKRENGGALHAQIGRTLSADDRARIINLRATGVSASSIGKQFGISRHSVRHLVERLQKEVSCVA